MNKVFLARISCVFMLAFLLANCASYKRIVYVQDIDTSSNDLTLEQLIGIEMKLEPNDNLYISVTATNPDAVKIFRSVDDRMMYNSEALILQGYLIDKNGYINFPIIGQVKLGGLTKKGAIKLLQSRIEKDHVDDPIVNIRLLNFKIGVQGEVNRPNIYNVKDEKITILQAISMAGDLTIYGRRDNVLVMREEADGRIVSARIDLTSADLFQSPFFYLKQNDQIYIQPNKAKSASSKMSPIIPLAFSAISTLVSIATLILTVIK